MITFYLISLVVFVIYIAVAIYAANNFCLWDMNKDNLYVGRNFIAIPTSLSATYYMFNSIKEKLGIVFTIMMFICSLTILPHWIESSSDNFRFLAFFGATGIAFVGAAPLFRKDMEQMVHYGAAVASVVTSVIWSILMGYWWMLVISVAIFIALGIYTKTIKQCRTFWIEMAMFFSIYSILFFRLF